MKYANSTNRMVKGALIIQLAGLAGLGIFRSDKLVSYAYDLAPNKVSERIVEVAQMWDAGMKKIGAAKLTRQTIAMIDTLRGSEEF